MKKPIIIAVILFDSIFKRTQVKSVPSAIHRGGIQNAVPPTKRKDGR